jgi:hypothetical protein
MRGGRCCGYRFDPVLWTAFLGSTSDAELLKFAGGGLGVQVNFIHEPRHALPDGLEELVHLLVRPFNDDLHPAVW